MNDHRCEEHLVYRGHIAAPGIGISFECAICEKAFVKLGARIIDPELEGVPELSPEDVR